MSSAGAARLEGVEGPTADFTQAIARGRLHHAWLLAGAEGLGKASLAMRVAQRLLGASPDEAAGPLGSAPGDPVLQLIAAGAHPDVMVLERRSEDGKLKKAISVEDARRLPEFFSKTPAIARCRVAIIDAADDLNVSSANALLKTLEEPSGAGVLLLVSHAAGALLPTIRSRCRVVRFAPWPVETLTEFGMRRLDLGATDAARLAVLAAGAPGRLLSLHAAGALELDAAVGATVSALPRDDRGAWMSLTDGLRGGEGATRFALVANLLAERAAASARGRVGSDGGDRWAASWARLTSLAAQVEELNLDRADAVLNTLADFKATASIAPPC